MIYDAWEVFRDYIVDGVSGSGAHRPLKGEIRNWARAREVGELPTRAEIEALTIPAAVACLSTSGYAAAGDGGGASYTRAGSEPSHAGKVQSDDGAWWEYVPGPEGVNGAAFGVIGDPADTYDTEWDNLLDYAITQNTGPSGLSGWGEARVILPKGRIRLTAAYSAPQSTIGLTIQGEGKYATSIEWESDSAHFLTVTTNIALTIKDLSLIHVDQGAGFGSWTCRMVNRSGAGGGAQLWLDNVHTKNWAYIDYNSGTVNNDTTRFTFCRFIDAQTVMYGRSSQAVINRIDHCSIGGKTTLAFDLAGYGYTVWSSCNIVIDGITLQLAAASGLYGASANYAFENCKWEAANNAAHGSGSRTQILVTATGGQYVSGSVVFRGCGYSGGSGTLDATNYPVLKVMKSVNVEWHDGAIRTDARVETIGTTTKEWDDHSRVLFKGMASVPLPTNLIQTDSPGTVHAAVVFENCVDVPNMACLNSRTLGGVNTRFVNVLSSGVSGYLESGSDTDHTLDFGGWKQRVVEVYETSASKTDDHNTTIYSDAGSTQIGDTLDVTTANGYTNGVEYVAPVANIANEIIDYAQATVANGLGSRGHIVFVTDAIPTAGT